MRQGLSIVLGAMALVACVGTSAAQQAPEAPTWTEDEAVAHLRDFIIERLPSASPSEMFLLDLSPGTVTRKSKGWSAAYQEAGWWEISGDSLGWWDDGVWRVNQKSGLVVPGDEHAADLIYCLEHMAYFLRSCDKP